MRTTLTIWLAAAVALLLAQTQEPPPNGVGDGAPTSALLGHFLQAYNRGSFPASVALPPSSKVHRDGSGYVQDFKAADATSTFNYALAKPDSLDLAFQMCCQILALHKSIGSFSGKIGYPVSDPNPGLQSHIDGTTSLQQNFEGGHALLLHQNGTYAGTAFFIRDPYVSRWRVTPALALPIGQERDTTSRFSTTATQQDFQGGIIFQITSGSLKDQVFVVSGPIYSKYAETSSWLGFPAGDETTVSGRQRQNFEGGFIEYNPVSGTVEARAPVSTIRIDATAVTLQVGNVITRTAEAFDNLGNPVPDRPVIWTTSNRAVIQIEGSGPTVRLRAVGPGFANITAFADGVSSATLRITVTSACCQVGEGAPNPLVRQAMQDALTRNNITPRLPADNAVRRVGAGYVQEFAALTPESLGRVQVLKADSAGLAYVVAGERLLRYLELGGPAGTMGFPTSDANAAGRQAFENQYLLGGSPPIVVAAPVSQKWAALGYEAGAAGAPRSEATPAGPTLFGTSGVAQAFAGGVLLGHSVGSRSGQAFLVAGAILARYNRLNGFSGILGLPTADAAVAGGVTRQSFEGGVIEHTAGQAEAQERLAARAPAITVFPSAVPIGGRVRISISGFAPGRRLLVTAGSAPEFEVTPASGAYTWEVWIRPGTAGGVYRVAAREPVGNESAEASYRVRSVEEIRYRLAKVSGDNQSALPASEAPLPLVVRLTDEAGSPIYGRRVLFGSVAGGVIVPAETYTDTEGYARARLRLPAAPGLVLATAEAVNQVVTFAARAEEGRLTTFPALRQGIDDLRLGGGGATIHQKGSLLTAVAALLRYHQDRGELPSPGGLAEPAALNQFLGPSGYLSFTLNGRPELVVNLPRALAFAGNAAEFEALAPEPSAIRDALNQRWPVLLGLMLRSGDQDRGAHYVVATGVGGDGGILIHDPSPDWNRTGLAEYLTGFNALGRSWTGRILHALRLRLGPRSPRGFLAHGSGPAPLRLSAPRAVQGYYLRIPALAAYDQLASDTGEVAQLYYADGTAPQYQLSVGDGTTATVAGITVTRGTYRITPDPLAIAPQTLSAPADGLRNAAGFGPLLARGSLASLFGVGLGEGLSVAVGGREAPLLLTLPYQANLQLPYELAPGPQAVEVTSAQGTARFEARIEEAAPGIFVLDNGLAAVLNQDGSLNTPLNPASRGTVLQVFVTGLGGVAPSVSTGASAPSSPLSRAVAEVTATVDGRPAPVAFAGLTPGFLGLGQVNVVTAVSFAPNAAAQLVIRAGGQESNTVPVALE